MWRVWAQNIVTVSHAKFDEVMMNFNHLVEKAALRDKCGALDTCCYYRPIGNVRTMLGENVHLTVVCKRIFYTTKTNSQGDRRCLIPSTDTY